MADPERSRPFLNQKLAAAGAGDAEQFRKWVEQLGDDEAAVRERATERLKANVHAVGNLLEAALADDPSPEAKRRIEGLLRFKQSAPPRSDPTEKAMRVLEYTKTR